MTLVVTFLGSVNWYNPNLKHPGTLRNSYAKLLLFGFIQNPLNLSCPQSKYGTPTTHQLNTIVVELLKPVKYLISVFTNSWVVSQYHPKRSYPSTVQSLCTCVVRINLTFLDLMAKFYVIVIVIAVNQIDSLKHICPLNTFWLRHTFFSFILLKHEQTKITNTTFHRLFPKPLGNIPPPNIFPIWSKICTSWSSNEAESYEVIRETLESFQLRNYVS